MPVPIRPFHLLRRLPILLALWMVLYIPSFCAAADGVFLEELTSSEVGDALKARRTTIIIPVGGTEQNGPHMALGKHNVRARVLAGMIAVALGNALVAPVVAYVPEGRISPPTEHMRYAGTISIPEETFKNVLDAAARSFKQHGFLDVVLIGDSGNYQTHLKAVADRLNRDWAATRVRAHFVEDYYRAAQGPYVKALRAKGLSDAQIGTHAGAADTSLLMAIDAALIRPAQISRGGRDVFPSGVAGDPRAATAELGQIGVDLIVTHSVAAIRTATAAKR
jgi:creatinine amidohydrolase/Fe(II)-dependent formamide hydrolase-like protein